MQTARCGTALTARYGIYSKPLLACSRLHRIKDRRKVKPSYYVSRIAIATAHDIFKAKKVVASGAGVADAIGLDRGVGKKILPFSWQKGAGVTPAMPLDL